MNFDTMKGLLDDPEAKIKVTLKDGESNQTMTVERTPQEGGMTANGLLGGMVAGMSPTPVADDKQINVTSGEYVVNKPAAQKYHGLLEDINNEGREMLARGGWTGSSGMDNYAKGGSTALDKKISKIYKEGYTAPGQAYAIAKNMGYQTGGQVGAPLTGDVEEDVLTIMRHPTFKRLVGESQMYGYDPSELPAHVLNSQIGRLFDTPEKQEALMMANAAAQAQGNAFAEGGPIGEIAKSKRGAFTAKAKAAGMGVQEYANHVLSEGSGASAETRKQANFARNAAKWGKAYGGEVEGYAVGGSTGQSEYHKSIYGPRDDTTWRENQNEPWVFTPEHDVSVTGDNTVTMGGPDIFPEEETPPVAQEAAPFSQPTPGVLDNRSYDYILEKSRGLAAGKGFGGAKLGAREYVDQLYAPSEWDELNARGASGTGGSKRTFNLEWRDPTSGELQVQAGRKNADGEFELQNENGEWRPANEVAGTSELRVAPRSADPGVEAGAGGIPNAVYFNETTKIPNFKFQRESEGQAYGWTRRAIIADRRLAELESRIPAEQLTSLYGGLARWAQDNSGKSITGAVVNDAIANSGLQQYSRQVNKFLQAVLRADTGAAYTAEEIAHYLSAFAPAPGEVVGPDTLRTWQQGRRDEIGSLIGRTGDAGPYLNGLLAGEYGVDDLDIDDGIQIAEDGRSGITSGGVSWSVE